MRKIDAHVHANTMQSAFLRQARADGFELVSINVDYPDFPAIDIQRRTAGVGAPRSGALPLGGHLFHAWLPSAAWLERTQAQLARDVAAGAVAVKVWKNVGMVEIDPDGHRVMLDDPRLAPLAAQVQALGVPLIDHQGEPYNCWLPLEQMTTDNDREYFRLHPQYHMYLHPDEPGYEQLMAVRDRFVQAHPGCASSARTWPAWVRRGSPRRLPRPLPGRRRGPRRAHDPGAVPVAAQPRQGA